MSIACTGLIDTRAQAEVPSERRSDIHEGAAVKGAYAAGRRDDVKELGARLCYPGGCPGSSWPYGLWGSVPGVKSGLGSLR